MITVETLLEHMAGPVNANAPMVWRGRHIDTSFLLGVGEAQFYVTVKEGRITAIEQGPKPLRAVSFSIKAGIEAWNDFWAAVPKAERGSYDILGLAKNKRAVIDGNAQVFMTHLRYFKDVLTAPRGRMETLHG